ncbi:MAG: hypothetical protein KDG56_20015, partial [Ottowia sp.]|nr:hypothetical protein [Ottowia sp.]
LGEPSARARFARTDRLIRIGFARARAGQTRYLRRNGRLHRPAAVSAYKLLPAPVALAER